MVPPAHPFDPVGDLISDKWVLSIQRDGRYVAFRPFGWTGPDRHEQVTADTREELLAKLRYRANYTRNEDL